MLRYDQMAQNPLTIYANIITFRLTPSEFVLEFGAHFPEQPNQAPPSDYRPDVRVVLPRLALQGITQALQQAAQQQGAGAQAGKPAPGFQPPKDKP